MYLYLEICKKNNIFIQLHAKAYKTLIELYISIILKVNQSWYTYSLAFWYILFMHNCLQIQNKKKLYYEKEVVGLYDFFFFVTTSTSVFQRGSQKIYLWKRKYYAEKLHWENV